MTVDESGASPYGRSDKGAEISSAGNSRQIVDVIHDAPRRASSDTTPSANVAEQIPTSRKRHTHAIYDRLRALGFGASQADRLQLFLQNDG